MLTPNNYHNNDEESRPLWIANSKHVGYSMCSVDLYPSSRPHWQLYVLQLSCYTLGSKNTFLFLCTLHTRAMSYFVKQNKKIETQPKAWNCLGCHKSLIVSNHLIPVATTTSLCFRVIELVFFRTVKSNWKAVGRIDEDHQRRIFIFIENDRKDFLVQHVCVHCIDAHDVALIPRRLHVAYDRRNR